MGGAIGDALGAPIEGIPIAQIREKYGPDGLTEYSPERVGVGAITDDTQMMAFTAQALIQASVRQRAKGIGGAAIGMLQESYLVWLRGQGENIPEQGLGGGYGWLGQDNVMMSRRGPGKTCLSALHKAAERQKPGWPLGTVDEPINDSKGCGGVMRAAPCGFGVISVEVAFDMGCRAAALTHGHPSGYLSAGVLAATVWSLVRGAQLDSALELARAELMERQGHEETSKALDAAITLARQGSPRPEQLERLGSGWTGEEALAMGVYAALSAELSMVNDPPNPYSSRRGPAEIGRRGLRLAVNHSGDSDSTGAICGNLLGARYGSTVFPGHWQANLEVRRTIIQLAADCALEFGPDSPTEPDGYGAPSFQWLQRSPKA
ncbi:ADP-ribosylglycohydrolase [Nocardiopsis gilva YIM 90087]|uniref:ADP-ribosylglycohydrolase n=1 Tax=Nocardiopsis gilva YIM 90087 TaxID=1235441 RepID=A0A223SD18_9ACTN|nr:ADP-ribosylglycohydrolase [Nocardiopsis gilva YIM 90087]